VRGLVRLSRSLHLDVFFKPSEMRTQKRA
jgi:hypothetical protein